MVELQAALATIARDDPGHVQQQAVLIGGRESHLV
jgi:hypothetical protein